MSNNTSKAQKDGKSIDLESTFLDMEGDVMGRDIRSAVVYQGSKEPVKDAQGNQMYVTLHDKTKTMTMRKAIGVSLMSMVEGDKPDEKDDYEKCLLRNKILAAGKTITLDLDERKMILERVNKVHSRLLYGQVRQAFE